MDRSIRRRCRPSIQSLLSLASAPMLCCLYPTHSTTKRAPSVADFPLYLCPLYMFTHVACLPLDLPALSLILLFFQQLVLVSFAASIPALVPCRN